MLTGEVPFKGENQVAVAMKHVRETIPTCRPSARDLGGARGGARHRYAKHWTTATPTMPS